MIKIDDIKLINVNGTRNESMLQQSYFQLYIQSHKEDIVFQNGSHFKGIINYKCGIGHPNIDWYSVVNIEFSVIGTYDDSDSNQQIKEIMYTNSDIQLNEAIYYYCYLIDLDPEILNL